MKRIVSLILCLLMVFPLFLFNTTAAETENRNVAPEWQTYHSSIWNGDRHSKFLNNGVYLHSYQMWEPSSFKRPNGAGVDDTKQYFGFSTSVGWDIIDEVIIYAKKFEEGFNNIKYSVEASILGEWVPVGVGYNDESVDYKVGDSTVGKLTIKLTHPRADQGEDINTNNIRIKCTEYGAHAKRTSNHSPATEHDWWYVPCVHEVELIGRDGYTPEFIVPPGAELVTNAALSGMMGATSSMDMYYPYLGGDRKPATYWKAASRGGNQSIWSEFDKEYSIDDISLNFGGCAGSDAGLTLNYNIEILTSGTIADGTWVTVVEDASAVTASVADDIVHKLDGPTKALAIRVNFTSVTQASGSKGRAVLTEIGATISEGKKCIFLGDYITSSKISSTAAGNLACYGTAYASSTFTYATIADVSYLIDGNGAYDDPAWISFTYIKGTYCGVTLREAHDVTKVVLNFDDYLNGVTQNELHIFEFEVQAKIGEEFVTVAKATSYDEKNDSFIVSVELGEAVRTDDIRIVFVSDAWMFPYLKEIEVYEKDYFYSSFVGFATSSPLGGLDATEVFGDRLVSRRGKYLDERSPIEYFNEALDYGIDIDWMK